MVAAVWHACDASKSGISRKKVGLKRQVVQVYLYRSLGNLRAMCQHISGVWHSFILSRDAFSMNSSYLKDTRQESAMAHVLEYKVQHSTCIYTDVRFASSPLNFLVNSLSLFFQCPFHLPLNTHWGKLEWCDFYGLRVLHWVSYLQ